MIAIQNKDGIYEGTPEKYKKDEDKYIYAWCLCGKYNKAIKIPRIVTETEKLYHYHFKCKKCGLEGIVTGKTIKED